MRRCNKTRENGVWARGKKLGESVSEVSGGS